MTKPTVFSGEILAHILNNADIPNIGDAAGLQNSAANGNLYVSMHTADPTSGGNQTTSETAYENYARIAAVRDGTFWNITDNVATPAADIDFAEAGPTSPGPALTHFGIGINASGSGKLLYAGALTPNITMAEGTIPRVKSTSTITET